MGDWAIMLQQDSLGSFSWQRWCAERKSRTYKASLGLGMVGTTLFSLHFIGQSKDGPDSRVGETDFLDAEAAKSYYKG